MCVIVDANAAAELFNPGKNYQYVPVVNWLLGASGKLAIGGQLEIELCKITHVREQLVKLKQAGKLRNIADKEIDSQAVTSELKSNDEHVIRLAMASSAQVLVSHDVKLHEDFTNKRVLTGRRKVYQNASHRGLLTKDTCP